MQLLNSRMRIRAPAQHVFTRLTDIAYIKRELQRDPWGRRLTIKHDRHHPFAQGKEIVFTKGRPLISMRITQSIPGQCLEASIELHSHALRHLGTAYMTCALKEHGEQTLLHTQINSTKKPGVIGRIFIRLTIWGLRIQSRRTERDFIRHIETTASGAGDRR